MDAWTHRMEPRAQEDLSRLLLEHPEVLLDCGHDYPRRHGIGYVRAGDTSYSLLRCVTCDGDLTLFALNRHPRLETEAVPLWFQGRPLEFWAAMEERSPREASTDYRRIQEIVDRASDAELRVLLDILEDEDDD